MNYAPPVVTKMLRRIATRWRFSCFALLLLLSLNPACLSQTITVRMIDKNNGRPLHWANQTVSFDLADEWSELQRPLATHGVTTTDPHGEARFEIPSSRPKLLSISVRLASNLWQWHCTCGSLLKTQDAIDKGVVIWNTTSVGSQGKVEARPGDILILAKPPSLFERLFGWAVKE